MAFCCVGQKKIDRFLRGSLMREGRLNLFWNVQIYFRNLVDWWTAKGKKKDITQRCGQIATKNEEFVRRRGSLRFGLHLRAVFASLAQILFRLHSA
jgi:hypothetical protein